MPKTKPETLLKADSATLTVRAEKDGKLRVTYHNWSDAVVILPDQVLELRWVDGQVHAIRNSCAVEQPGSSSPS